MRNINWTNCEGIIELYLLEDCGIWKKIYTWLLQKENL